MTLDEKGMLIGTATSAHQVEGNNVNSDWWFFEKSGKIKYRSGLSCDQYHLYGEDIKIMKKLGLNAYRFSIEFARIYPKEGKVNKSAIEHYLRLIHELKANGIEPIVTLWHFTLPKWFLDLGGFEVKKNYGLFEDYVLKVVNSGLDVKYVLTMNEPVIYTRHAYLSGDSPPFKDSPMAFRRTLDNLLYVNNSLYTKLKRYDYEVSFANAMYGFKHPKLIYPIYKSVDYALNWWFLKRTKFDFVGINYYRAIDTLPIRRSGWNEMRWSIYPEGLYTLISRSYSMFNKPIMVTENGLATNDDKRRSQFILSHFKQVEKARQKGIPVIGYMYWSFIDNFEWSYGYTKHFGIVSFNPRTLKRRIKPSAHTLKRIAERYTKRSDER